MKRINKIIVLLILFLGIITSTRAQDLPVAAVIDLRTIEAEHVGKILQAKLNTALTDAGVHSEGEAGMYLVGELTPVASETVEGGMRKIQIHTYQLKLKLEQPILNMQFGSTTITLEGSGYDNACAAMAAVRNFNPASSNMQNFIKTSINKAAHYYDTHIDAICEKADLLTKNKQYDEAIAMLWAVPTTTSVRTKVYSALERTFTKMQKNECTNLLNKARNAFALQRYDEAMEYLNSIDADSACGQEAKQLSSKIGSDIRTFEKEALAREERSEQRRYAALENERNRQTSIEKHRIRAVENIAKSYYQSHRISTYYAL